MGVHTEYVVNRAVTILGREYQRGDRIDNPEIPARVIDALIRSKKIGQKVEHDAEVSDGGKPVERAVQSTEPPVQSTESHVAPGGNAGGGSGGSGGSGGMSGASGAATDAPGSNAGGSADATKGLDAYEQQWRNVWQRRPAEDGSTFKAFLLAKCREAGLTIGGGVPALLKRLAGAKVRIE